MSLLHRPRSPHYDLRLDDGGPTFAGMIVTGIALVVVAVAVPGVQFAVILLGAAAVAWATFHLKMTRTVDR